AGLQPYRSSGGEGRSSWRPWQSAWGHPCPDQSGKDERRGHGKQNMFYRFRSTGGGFARVLRSLPSQASHLQVPMQRWTEEGTATVSAGILLSGVQPTAAGKVAAQRSKTLGRGGSCVYRR